MQMTRRTALATVAGGACAVLSGVENAKFQPAWESLKQYRCPEWFRDAKFGVWAHWGPQGAPKQGDWYARNMYVPGTRQYKYHLEHFGHPSQFGYKDIIPLWTGSNWEPETLIRRYKRMGARYFAALGAHCDNFDCWNSRHHRWNAVNYGPKRDVVGTWAGIARDHGMRFAVSEHLAWSYSWFNVNKNADETGPYAGVPYDGNDPRNQDLYFPPHPDKSANYAQNPSDYFKWSWFVRVKDLIDQHKPDLVYTDGGVFGQVGLNLMAHYYNANMSWNKGDMQGVYTIKNHRPATRFGDYEEGVATRDLERGLLGDIQAEPFQTDTCLGQWQYFEGFKYKTPLDVVHMLIDVVSKNGTMMLSVPQLPDGTIDSQEEGILDEITKWMLINGEAIFETRPWKKFGEGPTSVPGGLFSERRRKPFTSADVRFTTKGGKLYAFVLGWPEKDMELTLLGSAAGLWTDRIANVRMLGSQEKLKWALTPEKLVVRRPAHQPCDFAIVLEISA